MLVTIAIPVVLFASLLLLTEFGCYLARWMRVDLDRPSTHADAVLFAVLGLLIAFVFTTTATRFQERRELAVQQVNALGTAWLRVDSLKPEDQAGVRLPMQQWATLAGDASRFVRDPDQRQALLQEAQHLQQETWLAAVEAIDRRGQPQLYTFVLNPVNDWIDLTTSRLAMDDLGLPRLILETLVLLSLLSAILAGFNMSRREPGMIHKVAFALAISFSIYVIFDLSQPRGGFITVDHMDRMFTHLAQQFEQQAAARGN